MTVSSENFKNTYAGDGGTTEFAYDFRILDQSHLLVQLKDADNVLTTQTITTHYTVDGVGESDGGNVTFLTAPASTETVVITRNVPIKQETDYVEFDSFPAESHEEALDELTMIAQEQQEEINRSLKLDPEVSGFTVTIPDPTSHASKYLTLNASANAFEFTDVSTSGDLITIPVPVVQGGTGTTTGDLTLVKDSNRTIEVAEETTGAGSNLTIAAGAAATADSNVNGGTLVLASGTSEGTGTGTVNIQTAAAGSSGSTTNSVATVASFTSATTTLSSTTVSLSGTTVALSPSTAVTTTTPYVQLNPHDTGAGDTAEIRMLELAANGTNYTGFKSPDSLAGNVIYTMPSADGINNGFLTTDGSAGLSWTNPTKSFSITIPFPNDSEDSTITFTNSAITISEMRAVLVGSSTPSVTWTIRHGTDRSAAGNEVVTSGTTTTSTTSGSDVTSFNDATIPADSFIWLETTAQSGTVAELHVTGVYTED